MPHKDINERRACSRRYYRRLRYRVLTHYSVANPPTCECCGEAHLEFLCIDHINGGGAVHRGINIYEYLKRNEYPAGFRVLCNNCNQALGAYGICPHTLG